MAGRISREKSILCYPSISGKLIVKDDNKGYQPLHMPTSKDILLGHEAIVHGSTTTEATLHNDYKKPQQDVLHNLKGFFFLNTLVTPIVIINIDQFTIGGETKVALKWKRKRQQPTPTNPRKKPKRGLSNARFKCNGQDK
jgi:hypothetical protein